MISSSTFIRNNIDGAFCLFESMASFLWLVDEMIIVDLGSTDGTLEILRDIADHNRKIRLYESKFTCSDAAAFADAANQCVQLWRNECGIFWQADEIPHQNLLRMIKNKFLDGKDNFALWRVQLRENFQNIKWFPHPVHRIGKKSEIKFVGDGMNSEKVYGVDVCSSFNMGWFSKWGEWFKNSPTDLPTHEMLLDVSQVGAFRDNIPERRNLHAPMWHESNHIEGIPPDQWIAREMNNANWEKKTTPFDIPEILKYHLGRTRYTVRPELIEALKTNNVEGILGL